MGKSMPIVPKDHFLSLAVEAIFTYKGVLWTSNDLKKKTVPRFDLYLLRYEASNLGIFKAQK